ncbi:MAG: hypothetical protein D6736_06255 [Nitrospinota bacterium]|nr:MAG: hypothetical protein D6736_06255 [Nitrospinota bacterium]
MIPNGFYLAALLDLIAKQVDASAFLATLPLPSALLSLLEQVNTEVRDRLSNLQGTDEQLLRAVLLQLGPAAFRITGITLTPENVEAAPPFSVAVNQGDIDRVAGVNSGPPQVIVEGGLFLEGEVIRLNEEKTIRTDTPTAAVYFTKPLDTATTDRVQIIVENRRTTTTLPFTPQDTQSFAEVFWRENDSVLFIQVTNRNETFKLRDNTPYEVNVDVPSTVKAKDGTAFRADVIGPILFFVDLP